MIFKAYEISVENTEKMSLQYMDKILKNWYDKGVKTPMDAEKNRENFQSKKAKGKKEQRTQVHSENSSYDLDAFAKKAVGLKFSK